MKLHLLLGRWPLFGAGRCGADQSPHLFLRKQLKFDSFSPKWRHEDASRFIRATRYFQFYYRHETRRRLHGVCVCVCVRVYGVYIAAIEPWRPLTLQCDLDLGLPRPSSAHFDFLKQNWFQWNWLTHHVTLMKCVSRSVTRQMSTFAYLLNLNIIGCFSLGIWWTQDPGWDVYLISPYAFNANKSPRWDFRKIPKIFFFV